MNTKHIPSAVIRRLPRYYRYLNELLGKGVRRISSAELSERMHVTASQIRQDLNHFGGFGQQGYGYNIEYLQEEIGHILGQDQEYRLIIIGAGNLGQSVANYANFERKGYKVCALFDNDPGIIGGFVRGNQILSVDALEQYLAENEIDIAVIAIPKEGAREIAERLVSSGIQAIWNFASVDLNSLPKDRVVIENVHLSDSLRVLTYQLKELKGEDNE